MRLRYAGTCRVCGTGLPAKTAAIYETLSKTFRCAESCVAMDDSRPAEATVEMGTPGASARRESERRRARNEKRVRAKHPRLGGLILALADDPQSTRAWATGAVGEEQLGNRLNELASDALLVVHDRRMPRSKANIDHLVVTPTGVFVIDAKRYQGRPHLRVEGGILRPRSERLLVGTRDCTKMVDSMLKQLVAVREVTGDSVPVHGVLCFMGADWPLIGGACTTRGVEVLWPKKLYPKLKAAGQLEPEALLATHARLASSLPPA